MNTVYCARCDAKIGLDADHSHVIIERKRIDDRNRREDYYLCRDCEIEILDEWTVPA